MRFLSELNTIKPLRKKNTIKPSVKTELNTTKPSVKTAPKREGGRDGGEGTEVLKFDTDEYEILEHAIKENKNVSSQIRNLCF